MRVSRNLSCFLWVGCVLLWAGCAKNPSPPQPEPIDSSTSKDTGDETPPGSGSTAKGSAGKASPGTGTAAGQPGGQKAAAPAKSGSQTPPTGEGAGTGSLAEAKKFLDANRFEDLLGVFEPDQAKRLQPPQKAELSEIYFEAAKRLRDKLKDISFSSLCCERGLLLSPMHQGLLRLQIRNYLSPDMMLVGGAEELAMQLVKIDPNDIENQLLRGKVAMEQGDFDEAVNWFKKAARVGRTQKGPLVEEAWKMLDMAKGRQDELKSSLSMTKELEAMMVRVKAQAAKGTPPEPPAESGKDDVVEAPGGRVVLYMTRWCKYCAKTRELLHHLGVKFEEKDIEQSSDSMMELMNLAQSAGVEVNGVPVVRIGNNLVVGYNPQRIESLVQQIK